MAFVPLSRVLYYASIMHVKNKSYSNPLNKAHSKAHPPTAEQEERITLVCNYTYEREIVCA